MTEKFRGRLASRYLRSLLSGALLALPMTAMAVDVQVAAFTDTPDPVAAGGLVTYAARLDNNDTDAALALGLLQIATPNIAAAQRAGDQNHRGRAGSG